MAGLRKTVIGAVYPLASGVAQFNGAHGPRDGRDEPGDVISWRRMYPPLLPAGRADPSRPALPIPTASFMLDWHDPRRWRRAVERVSGFDADA